MDDAENRILLFWAARTGRLDDVRVALEHGVDVNSLGKYGETALDTCLQRGHFAVAKYLFEFNGVIKQPAELNKWPDFKYAVKKDRAMADFLKSKLLGIELDTSEINLCEAIEREDTETAIGLIKQDASCVQRCDSNGIIPLHAAAQRNLIEIATLLLQHGADVNVQDEDYEKTPLYEAAYAGKEKMCEFLISNGADVNCCEVTYGRTPLHEASQNGFPLVVELLIKNGAEINKKDADHEMTALHLAAQSNRKAVLEVLLKNGADILATDSLGRSYDYYLNQWDKK